MSGAHFGSGSFFFCHRECHETVGKTNILGGRFASATYSRIKPNWQGDWINCRSEAGERLKIGIEGNESKLSGQDRHGREQGRTAELNSTSPVAFRFGCV